MITRYGTLMIVAGCPDRAAQIKARMDALKIKTPKQFRAAINATKCGRNYPKFVPGMDTARYVALYYDANYNVGLGHYSEAKTFRGKAEATVGGFFEALSTSPQYALTGPEVVEEVEA